MGLGLRTEAGGNFESRPYVKYDAKAGRMFSVDRVQGADGSYANQTGDITNGFAAVFDLAQIQVGWLAFTAQGPSHALVPLGQPLPAKPGETHKQGFSFMIYSKSLGAREFSSSAKAVLAAVDALHDAFTVAPEAKEGKLPVIQLAGVDVVETTSKHGTNRNYAPKFVIAQWVPRPEALKQKPTASAAPPAAPPAQRAQPVPPPAPVAPPQAAQPAPAALNADDFG